MERHNPVVGARWVVERAHMRDSVTGRRTAWWGRRFETMVAVRERCGFDVVFYVPFIGSILTRDAACPPGGAETQILLLARTLARQGRSVAMVVYGDADALPTEVDGVRIVPRPYPTRATKRVVGKIIESARIWQSLWRAPSRTVVYRCAGVELGLVGSYTRLAGRRLVFSTANVVDFDVENWPPRRRDRMFYRLGVRLADEIVVQTNEQVDLCTKRFGRTATMIKSLAAPGSADAAAPEAFLWVGRITSYKRPLAFLDLARAVPEAKFWMVGVPAHDDVDAHLSRQVAEAARQIPNLQLLSPRPHAEIQQLMGRAVASVNTADFEGMPNVLLEAWRLGVPALVLTHDPDGVVTEYGIGGFAAGSRERFAQLARELWEGRRDRSQLQARCRSYVAEHHEADAVARKWGQLISSGDHEGAPTAEAQTACVE